MQIHLPDRKGQVAKYVGLAACVIAMACQLLGYWPSDADAAKITNSITFILMLVAPSSLVRTSPGPGQSSGPPIGTTMLMILLVPIIALTACSIPIGSGTNVSLVPPKITQQSANYAFSVGMIPNADPSAIEVETRYERKDGTLPDIQATLTKPLPNVAQLNVVARPVVPTPTPAPKQLTVEK